MKVLVVEDQTQLGLMLQQCLSESRYTVTWARTCAEANDAITESTYEAIVLDIGLPDGNGLDLLRDWRQGGFNEPVLILSARDGVENRVKGLDVGADDYLPKPFSFEELRARVRSLLRRQSAVKLTVLEHNGIVFDLVTRTVKLNGALVDLTSREYALLEIFMHNQGRILPRSLITEKVWESHYEVDSNLLDVYMSRLRNKLEAALGHPVFKTLRGVGYQLV
ncbi:response regulator transcription factor [uncultured Pseudomonas sp.]|uniref:response regulator transcription factor n=1 Tax=uncultured Pseudomonas sp. TaxID=114707 RepID=UPI00258E61BF|nr:response regulator transcription factor [uncultured Pseudomonas sp.]